MLLILDAKTTASVQNHRNPFKIGIISKEKANINMSPMRKEFCLEFVAKCKRNKVKMNIESADVDNRNTIPASNIFSTKLVLKIASEVAARTPTTPPITILAGFTTNAIEKDVIINCIRSTANASTKKIIKPAPTRPNPFFISLIVFSHIKNL